MFNDSSVKIELTMLDGSTRVEDCVLTTGDRAEVERIIEKVRSANPDAQSVYVRNKEEVSGECILEV